MRILISGCGGIGGNLGARLVHAGQDVTFLTANPKVTAALREHGAQMSGVDVGDSIPEVIPIPQVVTDASELTGTYDCVLMVCQTPALESACEAILPVLHDESVVVCLQNGLPEPVAQRIVGDRVLGCVVGWGGSMPQPGQYVRTSTGDLHLGEPGGGMTDRVKRVAAILETGITVDACENLPGIRWSKLAINSAITTIGAVCGAPLGSLLRRRHLRRAFLEVVTEAVQVAEAQGVKLEPVNGTFDLTQLALTARERQTRMGSPSLFKKHSIVLAVGFKYRRLRSSMLYAMEKGRSPEVRWLNGAIAENGKRVGVSTPVNESLCEIVEGIADGRRESTFDNLTPQVLGTLVRGETVQTEAA